MRDDPKWYQEGKAVGDLLLKARLTITLLAIAPIVGTVWVKRKFFSASEPEPAEEPLYGCYAKPKPKFQASNPTDSDEGDTLTSEKL